MKKTLNRLYAVMLAVLFAVTMLPPLSVSAQNQSTTSNEAQLGVNLSLLSSDIQIGEHSDFNRTVVDLSSLPYVVGDNYVEVQIPVDALQTDVMPFAVNPLWANVGTMSASFPRGSLSARSQTIYLDARINSIPTTARVTNVSVSYQVGTDPWSGVFRHIIHVGHTWDGVRFHVADFWPNYPQSAPSQLINSSGFNNRDPWGIWSIQLVATRQLLPNMQDNGATAIIRSVTLRIYWR